MPEQDATVMVVSGHSDTRVASCLELAQSNYDVIEADSLQEAAQQMAKRSVHVLLADTRIAGPAGEEFLRQLRGFLPKIILCLVDTGCPAQQLRGLIMAARPEAVFRRKVDTAEIARLIRVRRAAAGDPEEGQATPDAESVGAPGNGHD